nr:hypothetical protein CFP56_63078 [Quercus suber]POF18535.1 hypothetical protein CFP56_63079 [Quercus suber]
MISPHFASRRKGVIPRTKRPPDAIVGSGALVKVFFAEVLVFLEIQPRMSFHGIYACWWRPLDMDRLEHGAMRLRMTIIVQAEEYDAEFPMKL